MLLVAGIGPAWRAQPLPPSLSPQMEWEHAIEAKGGHSALRAVKTLVIKRTAEGGLTRQHNYIEQLVVPPSRLWSWYDSSDRRFGKSITVIDVDRQWRGDAGEGSVVTLVSAPSIGEVHTLRDLLICTLLDVSSAQLHLIRAVVDGKYVRLDGTLDDELYKIYLDRRTHLPAKVVSQTETPHGLASLAYELSDYAAVDGINLPGSMRTRLNDSGAFKWRVTFEVNVAYDERAFTEPPLLANGPDGWRLVR
jgi:hypothetical protein